QNASGTAESWFYFDSPTEADEVRVEMRASGGNQVIARAYLPIRIQWTGETIAAQGSVSGSTPPPAAAATVVRIGSLEELGNNGAFGFPQARAGVLCDTPQLRFSVCNDGEFFFAQAVLWGDGDDSVGKTGDGRAIGDWSKLRPELG